MTRKVLMSVRLLMIIATLAFGYMSIKVRADDGCVACLQYQGNNTATCEANTTLRRPYAAETCIGIVYGYCTASKCYEPYGDPEEVEADVPY